MTDEQQEAIDNLIEAYFNDQNKDYTDKDLYVIQDKTTKEVLDICNRHNGGLLFSVTNGLSPNTDNVIITRFKDGR